MKNFFYAICLLAILLASCDEKKVTSLAITERNKTMVMGETYQLEVTAYPLEAAQNATIVWATSDAKVATVSSDGTVSALSPGEITITASSDKAVAVCNLTVLAVQADFTFSSAVAYFLGDVYSTKSNYVVLRLLPDDLLSDSSGNLGGEGFFMNIGLNLAVADSVLKKGTYQLASTGKAFTFYPGDNAAAFAPGSYLGQKTNEGVGAIFLKSGSFTIEEPTSGSIAFFGSFVGNSGEILNTSYDGKVAFFDALAAPTIRKEMDFSIAKASDMGKQDNGFNLARISMLSATDTLQLDFNVELSVSKSVPVGKYEVSNSAKSFSLSSGMKEGESYKGTCYFSPDGKLEVTSGTVQVSLDSKNNYTISYELYAKGLKLVGTYKGMLSF